MRRHNKILSTQKTMKVRISLRIPVSNRPTKCIMPNKGKGVYERSSENHRHRDLDRFDDKDALEDGTGRPS